MKKLAVGLASLLLGGCQSITALGSSFEGANDFRVVPVSRMDEKPVKLGTVDRFQSGEKVGAADKVISGDNVLISLKTIYIDWFREGILKPINSAVSALGITSPTKGEVAIVANVTQGARNPGSLDSEGKLEGRVVFYGNDLYYKQLANEYNVPIFGPEKWNGGPLTIDLWVMELDVAENSEYSSILQTLSSLASSAGTLGPTGIKILEQIGTAFLKSNQDDVIGHLTVTLVPPGTGKATDPVLQYSDVIVARAENRPEGVQWAGCGYDAALSEIICTDPATQLKLSYNALVLSIRKSDFSTSIVPQVELDQFRERLTKANDTQAVEQLQALTQQMEDKALYQRNLARGVDQLQNAETQEITRVFRAEEVALALQCGALGLTEEKDEEGKRQRFDATCGSEAKMLSLDEFNELLEDVARIPCFDGTSLTMPELVPEGDVAALSEARTKLAASMAKPGPCPVAVASN